MTTKQERFIGQGHNGLYELLYKDGEKIPENIAEKIMGLDPPHRPGVSGRVYLKDPKTGDGQGRSYASGIGCHYIKLSPIQEEDYYHDKD